MRAIVVMFDSLNRAQLPPCGGQDVIAPNFDRLASRSTTFEKSYAGSLPCMSARRELHTGRYNFLHRSRGPRSRSTTRFRPCFAGRGSRRIVPPTTCTIGRTAAPRTTLAIRPAALFAGGRATPGRAEWPTRRRSMTSVSTAAARGGRIG